jgi:hypothetical protein
VKLGRFWSRLCAIEDWICSFCCGFDGAKSVAFICLCFFLCTITNFGAMTTRNCSSCWIYLIWWVW